MATVYKRRELRPIPKGAEIITYRGKPYATGTDGRAAEVVRGQMRGQSGRKTLQDTAGRCEPGGNSLDESGCHNVLVFSALGDNRRDVAKPDESRPGGI